MGFIPQRAFVMLLRKERRKGKGERRRGCMDRGGRSGVSVSAGRHVPRFPACQALTARTSPPPPGLGAFRGNPTGGRAQSWGIPANTVPRRGRLSPCPSGHPHLSADSSGQGALGTVWNPRETHCTGAHTHTHKARGGQDRRGQLAVLRGRTSRGYSLVSLYARLAGESGAAGGADCARAGALGSRLGRQHRSSSREISE